MTVLDGGPSACVQDAGRPGLAHLGVPRAGAVDPVSAAAANRLVGNAPGAPVVECLLGGFVCRFEEAVTVAVAGAGCPVAVDGRAVAFGEALSLAAGSVLRLGTSACGLRTYVAVAGGVLAPVVLGSRSTDTLAGVGPGALAAGDVLPIGAPAGPPADGAVLPALPPSTVRYRVAPRAELLAGLPAGEYEVLPASNRVGVRLAGAPISRSPAGERAGELPSEGMVLGAIQVPPDGQPVVFLADHPTTGGYPVVGVVLPDDLPGCAQLRPGDTVELRPLVE